MCSRRIYGRLASLSRDCHPRFWTGRYVGVVPVVAWAVVPVAGSRIVRVIRVDGPEPEPEPEAAMFLEVTSFVSLEVASLVSLEVTSLVSSEVTSLVSTEVTSPAAMLTAAPTTVTTPPTTTVTAHPCCLAGPADGHHDRQCAEGDEISTTCKVLHVNTSFLFPLY